MVGHEARGDDRERGGPLVRLVRGDPAATGRRDAQRFEEVAEDEAGVDDGRPVTTGKGVLPVGIEPYRGEGSVPLPPVLEVRD